MVYAWNGKGYSDVSGQYKEYYQQKLASLKKQIAAVSYASRQARRLAAGETPGSVSPPEIHVRAGSPRTAGPSYVEESGENSAQQQAPSVAATPAPMEDSGNLDCLRAEAAKIERFLGISSDAGIDDAIKWANSDDPWTRVFASEILAAIDTPDARLYLRSLSKDPNRMVAGEAKDDLESGQAEQHTVDQVHFGGPPSN
jgi:hypothetical protein